MRRLGLAAVGLGAALCITSLCVANVTAPAAAETPKRGGILTFMIPADAPPSFDGHRETTFATLHAVAPFYSVLIRVNPDNPSSTTDFVCDLCTEMPQPTDGGLIGLGTSPFPGRNLRPVSTLGSGTGTASRSARV